MESRDPRGTAREPEQREGEDLQSHTVHEVSLPAGEERLVERVRQRFVRVGSSYHFEFDDRTLSSELSLSEKEHGIFFAALSDLAERYGGRTLDTGFVGIDTYVRPESLLLARSFNVLLDCGQFPRPEDRKTKEIQYGEMLHRLVAGSSSRSYGLFQIDPRFDRVQGVVEKLLSKDIPVEQVCSLPGSPEKPFLLLLPDIHFSGGDASKENVSLLHSYQEEIFRECYLQNIPMDYFEEGARQTRFSAALFTHRQSQQTEVNGMHRFAEWLYQSEGVVLETKASERADLFFENLAAMILTNLWHERVWPERAELAKSSVTRFVELALQTANACKTDEGMNAQLEGFVAKYERLFRSLKVETDLARLIPCDIDGKRHQLRFSHFPEVDENGKELLLRREPFIARFQHEFARYRSFAMLDRFSEENSLSVIPFIVGVGHVQDLVFRNFQLPDPHSIMVLNPYASWEALGQYFLPFQNGIGKVYQHFLVDEALFSMRLARLLDY